MASQPGPSSPIRALAEQQHKPQDVFVPQTPAQTLFLTLEDPTFSRLAKNISNLIMGLIVMGCITYVMETMESFQRMNGRCTEPVLPDGIDMVRDAKESGRCSPKALTAFGLLETICILIFTVEYIGRILTVHSVPESIWNIKEDALEEADPDAGVPVRREKTPLGLTWGYATTFMNCIDIVAILPFYIEKAFSVGSGLGVIRVMRLTRVLRVLKSPKFAEAVKLFSLSLTASMPALSILFFFSLLGIILMGSLTFFFEQGKFNIDDDVCCPPGATDGATDEEPVVHVCQLGCFKRPDYLGMGYEPSPFTSIPTSFYWVIVTMTTVGYGDLLPTTSYGRVMSMFVMYGGIFGLALPITVIGANFSRQYELLNQERERKRKEVEALQRTGAADVAAQLMMRARSSIEKNQCMENVASGGGLEVEVRPGPSSVRYEIADVTDEDEAAALTGELRNDMNSLLAALPRVESAVAANCKHAQDLQERLQRLRSAVTSIQQC